VPPFRAGERDRYAGDAAFSAWLDRRVLLGASWSWLADRSPDAEWTAGPGDLRLGTAVHLVSFGDLGVYAGWEVKLPNAADEGELGTDETDVAFGGQARWDHGPWTVAASVGLGVWGNPLRFAAQDDVPMLRASGAWRGEWLAVSPSLTADLDTSRNPARVHAGVELRAGRALYGYAAGEAGLTPADADGTVRVGIGLRGRVEIPPPAADALPSAGGGA
jgi:hypothetical protein